MKLFELRLSGATKCYPDAWGCSIVAISATRPIDVNHFVLVADSIGPGMTIFAREIISRAPQLALKHLRVVHWGVLDQGNLSLVSTLHRVLCGFILDLHKSNRAIIEISAVRLGSTSASLRYMAGSYESTSAVTSYNLRSVKWSRSLLLPVRVSWMRDGLKPLPPSSAY